MVGAYRRVDLGPRETYLTALQHLRNYLRNAVSGATKPGSHIVLHQWLSKKYLVVNVNSWCAQNWSLKLSTEQAMHQAAETFDTLEQAMLYYHLVK